MTRHDRHKNSDDLPEFLHELAASAAESASDIDDDAFADTVLERGQVLRRKRRRRNTLVAAACLAIVAVVGAAAITNLPSSGDPEITVADDPYGLAQCGASVPDEFSAGGPRGSKFEELQLVSEEHSDVDEDGSLTVLEPADQESFLTNGDSEPFLPLLLANLGTDRAHVGALGPAGIVLAKDGVVVTTIGAERESPLSFHGGSSTRVGIGAATPVPCPVDGSEPHRLPEGEYEAYGLIEVGAPSITRGGSGDEELNVVYGGPWKVRIGEPVPSDPVPDQVTSDPDDALPDLDPTATFPACGAPVPESAGEFGLEGDPENFVVELDPTGTATAPIERGAKTWAAGGSLLNSSGDQVWGTMNQYIEAVFVQDGRVVGALADATDSEQLFMARPDDHIEISYSLSTGVCGPGERDVRHLPVGNYEVWGSMDLQITERKGPEGKTRAVDESLRTAGLLETVKFTD